MRAMSNYLVFVAGMPDFDRREGQRSPNFACLAFDLQQVAFSSGGNKSGVDVCGQARIVQTGRSNCHSTSPIHDT